MDVIKKMKPGEPGTKRLLAKYGDQLVCVRYRNDKLNQRRLTTIELIIDDAFYLPSGNASRQLQLPNANRNILVRVEYQESELRRKIKLAGGKWSRERKRWLLRFREAEKLGLKSRIEEIENVQI